MQFGIDRARLREEGVPEKVNLQVMRQLAVICKLAVATTVLFDSRTNLADLLPSFQIYYTQRRQHNCTHFYSSWVLEIAAALQHFYKLCDSYNRPLLFRLKYQWLVLRI